MPFVSSLVYLDQEKLFTRLEEMPKRMKNPIAGICKVMAKPLDMLRVSDFEKAVTELVHLATEEYVEKVEEKIGKVPCASAQRRRVL